MSVKVFSKIVIIGLLNHTTEHISQRTPRVLLIWPMTWFWELVFKVFHRFMDPNQENAAALLSNAKIIGHKHL